MLRPSYLCLQPRTNRAAIPSFTETCLWLSAHHLAVLLVTYIHWIFTKFEKANINISLVLAFSSWYGY